MIEEKDIRFFLEMLSIDSTSGRERPMAEWLALHLQTPDNTVETLEDAGPATPRDRFSPCSWPASDSGPWA